MVGQDAYVNGPRKSYSGGAGYLNTANDYARFLQMMLSGGGFSGKRIISLKTLELMTVNHSITKMSEKLIIFIPAFCVRKEQSTVLLATWKWGSGPNELFRIVVEKRGDYQSERASCSYSYLTLILYEDNYFSCDF